MKEETLICLKGHTYNKAWIEPGSAFPVRARFAPVLIEMKRARRPEPGELADRPSLVPQIAPEGVSIADSINHGVDIHSMSKDELRDEYKRIFGKSAHGRMSEDSLREAIEKGKEE